jgi:hypothetical protein
MTPTVRLPLSLVYPSRSRPVVASQVAALADSLAVIGLKTPITVRAAIHVVGGRDVEAYDIIAGRHRYEAAVKLGWTEIDALVTAGDDELDELWEIDENLIRAELSDAQRADHHARREAILVRRGEVRATTAHSGRNADNLSAYSRKAADDLGVDERTVRRDLARGKKIAPEILNEVQGSALDKGVVLDELAHTPVPEQRAKLAEITLRRQEAERIRKDAESVNRATDRVIALTEAEEIAQLLHARFDLDEIDNLIARLSNVKTSDIISALKRIAA